MSPNDRLASSHFDAIVVGGGLAAMTMMLELPSNWRIALVNKSNWQSSSSYFAQGGIAAAMHPKDSIASHIQDTCIAGAGLCHQENTRSILSEGSKAIHWLQQNGVIFTQENGQLHLTREGGHSERRVVHAADATGKLISTALWKRIKSLNNVTFFNGYHAVDILSENNNDEIKSTGLMIADVNNNQIITLTAPHVVIATGGSGQLFPRTSNPLGATADGQAMAWRAGCELQNLEFIQFHPTGLSVFGAKDNHQCPLITEALRGEGAWLCLPDGQRFMSNYDARGELAPRDIVARAIYQEMQKHQIDHILLDIRHRGSSFIETHFPTIIEICKKVGIDPIKDAIPVAPLAHYACGGIVTDLDGRSNLSGLYAIGECAYTGLHGANRLASNSLLECVVMAKAASQKIKSDHNLNKNYNHQNSIKTTQFSTKKVDKPSVDNDQSHYLQLRQQLQKLMWDGAGILRTQKGLNDSYEAVKTIRNNFQAAGRPMVLSAAWLELRNLLDVALLTLESAIARTESCGAHYYKKEKVTAEALD